MRYNIMRAVVAILFTGYVSFIWADDIKDGDLPVLAASDLFVLTEKDIDQALLNIPEEYRKEIIANKSKLRDVINNIIIIKSVTRDARQHDFNKDEKIKVRLQLVLEKELANLYLVKKMSDKAEELKQKPDLLEARAKELYAINKEKYKLPAAVKAAHVLIKVDDDTSAEAAEQLAQKVYQEAKKGTDFAELVTTYSEDKGSVPNGGDLGFFTSGQMVKEFEQAAFALTPENPISQPVKTQFGYHVIKLIEKRPEAFKPFDAVKQELIDKVIQDESQKYRSAYMTDLLSKNVKVFTKNVEAYQQKHK